MLGGVLLDEYILELHDIVKTFGSSVVLNGMNFHLKRGEVHALMGENGAGKSTFIKIITGVYQPCGGEMIYNGRRVSPKKHDRIAKYGNCRNISACNGVS